jgi:hypothetical protein
VTVLRWLPDGTQVLVVPYAVSPWRLGQRVWLQIVNGRIEVTPAPQGRRGEHRYSGRLRRGREAKLRK